MTDPHPYATCPECGKAHLVVDGRFPDHRRPSTRWDGPMLVPCTGSGWIVEDEDRCTGRWPR